MRIAFATYHRKGSEVGAIYDHVVSLVSAVDVKNTLSLIEVSGQAPRSSPTYYDVAIAESPDAFTRATLRPLDGALTVYFQPTSKHKAALFMAANDEQKKAFMSKGISGKQIWVIGKPSLDVLFCNSDEQEALRRVFLRYSGLHHDRKTLLYMPENGDTMIRWDVVDRLIRFAESYSYNVIFCASKQDLPSELRSKIKKSECCAYHTRESQPDVVSMLIAADVLATDVDSVAMDYLALDRPIIFAEPEMGWHHTPTWYDRESLPGFRVNTTTDLCNAAVNLFEEDSTAKRRQDLRDKYHPHKDGLSCERVVDIVMENHVQEE